jgi:hypothetical protein
MYVFKTPGSNVKYRLQYEHVIYWVTDVTRGCLIGKPYHRYMLGVEKIDFNSRKIHEYNFSADCFRNRIIFALFSRSGSVVTVSADCTLLKDK